jgi:gamma-glutamyltranspeptidase/glutathione hydrolase
MNQSKRLHSKSFLDGPVIKLFSAGLLVLVVGGLLGMTSARASSISRGDRYAGAPWASRSPVLAQHGMAATEQPIASLTAIEILKKGFR